MTEGARDPLERFNARAIEAMERLPQGLEDNVDLLAAGVLWR